MPEPSSPSTMGTGMWVHEPSAACRQEWQTPLATILTRTSPSPGSARSTSSVRIDLPRSCTNAARIFIVAVLSHLSKCFFGHFVLERLARDESLDLIQHLIAQSKALVVE